MNYNNNINNENLKLILNILGTLANACVSNNTHFKEGFI